MEFNKMKQWYFSEVLVSRSLGMSLLFRWEGSGPRQKRRIRAGGTPAALPSNLYIDWLSLMSEMPRCASCTGHVILEPWTDDVILDVLPTNVKSFCFSHRTESSLDLVVKHLKIWSWISSGGYVKRKYCNVLLAGLNTILNYSFLTSLEGKGI